jgi:phage shock protein A
VRVFKKAWNYGMASLNQKVEQYTDPKIQIRQAIEQEKQRHAGVVNQAGAVIADVGRIESEVAKCAKAIEELRVLINQSLAQAEVHKSALEVEPHDICIRHAEGFAAQLVVFEDNLPLLQAAHNDAVHAASNAEAFVRDSQEQAKHKIAEGEKLLVQLEQAKLAEKTHAAAQSMQSTTLAPPGNTPTLDEVRAKIERRYATAMGSAELAQNSAQGNVQAVHRATVETQAQERLAQIRAEMKPDYIDGEVISESD